MAQSKRVSTRKSASPAKAEAGKSKLAYSLLSALGGAAVLFVTQIAVEEYKSSREAAARTVEKKDLEVQQRTQLLNRMFEEYQGLGDAPERAGEYIDNGREGSREDIGAVVRHFRKVVSYVVNGQLQAEAVEPLYGGRLAYWSGRLEALGGGKSPISPRFSARHKQNYLLLADALKYLAAPTSRQASAVVEKDAVVERDAVVEGKAAELQARAEPLRRSSLAVMNRTVRFKAPRIDVNRLNEAQEAIEPLEVVPFGESPEKLQTLQEAANSVSPR